MTTREQILQEAYRKGFEKGAQALPGVLIGGALGAGAGALLPAKSRKQRLLRALLMGAGGAAAGGFVGSGIRSRRVAAAYETDRNRALETAGRGAKDKQELINLKRVIETRPELRSHSAPPPRLPEWPAVPPAMLEEYARLGEAVASAGSETEQSQLRKSWEALGKKMRENYADPARARYSEELDRWVVSDRERERLNKDMLSNWARDVLAASDTVTEITEKSPYGGLPRTDKIVLQDIKTHLPAREDWLRSKGVSQNDIWNAHVYGVPVPVETMSNKRYVFPDRLLEELSRSIEGDRAVAGRLSDATSRRRQAATRSFSAAAPLTALTAAVPFLTRARKKNNEARNEKADAYARGFEKGAQESVPLMTPYSDRTLSHLSGKPITRRQVWETAVPPQRANTVINAAERYRADNPGLFEGVFDGRNIDRPVAAKPARDADFYKAYRHAGAPRTQANDFASREIGMYRPPYESWFGRVKPDQILTRRSAPFRTLAHETFHADTPATLPQAHTAAYAARRRGDYRPARNLLAVNRRASVPAYDDSGTVSNVQSATDSVYPSGGRNPVEIAPQLGTLRMHLEQKGVDTTNPDALRSALQNLGKYTGDNDEAQRFHDTLQNAPKTPDARDRTIEDVLKVMQGIATRKNQVAANLTVG